MKRSYRMGQLIKKIEQIHGKDFSQLGESLTIENKPFMDLHIECIAPNMISISHYYEQNGDMIADPDVEIWVMDGDYYPVAADLGVFGYRRHVVLNGDNTSWEKANLYQQADLATFCNTWATNIRRQGFVK